MKNCQSTKSYSSVSTLLKGQIVGATENNRQTLHKNSVLKIVHSDFPYKSSKDEKLSHSWPLSECYSLEQSTTYVSNFVSIRDVTLMQESIQSVANILPMPLDSRMKLCYNGFVRRTGDRSPAHHRTGIRFLNAFV